MSKLPMEIVKWVGGYSLLPLLGGCVAVNEIARLLNKLTLWPKGKYKMVQGARENYFYAMKKRGAGLITGLTICEYDAECSIEKDRALIVSTMFKTRGTEMFKQNLCLKRGYLCYEKGNFDIKNHVKMYPGVENRVVTEKELLFDILPKLQAPFENDKIPLWEIFLFPTVQFEDHPDPETLRVMRFCHSYTNGFGAFQMVYNAMDWENPENSPPHIFNPWKPVPLKYWIGFVLQTIKALPLLPPSLIEAYLLRKKGTESKLLASGDLAPEHVFHMSPLFPLTTLKEARKRNPGLGFDSIVATALKNALVSELQLEGDTQFPVMSVNIVPTICRRDFQNKCFWVYWKGKLSDKNVNVHMKPENLAQWLRDSYIERMPFAVQDYLLRIETFDVSAAVMNNTITKEKGKVLGKTVRKFASFSPECKPLGIEIHFVTYAGSCSICISAEKSVVPAEKVESLTSRIISEIKLL